MAEHRRVIVVDLDPQQSATRWAKQADPSTPKRRFSLAGDLHALSLARGVKSFRVDLEQLMHQVGADTVLMDCPPELADPALVAALISDLVLIPATPSPLDVWAAEAAVKTAQEAQAQRGGDRPHIIIVPSRCVVGTVLAREIKDTLGRFGQVGPMIHQRVALVESAVAGQTIDEYAPGSVAALEFKELAKYVLNEIHKY